MNDFDNLWDYGQPDVSEQRFLELLPHIAPELKAELLTQIARAQGLQRKFAQAQATLDKAEKRLRTPRARVRHALEQGRVLNSSGHPEEARPWFLRAWEAASAHGEDFHAVDAAHMLAIVGRGEEPREWNLQALELTEKTSDARAKKWLASLYNNLGWTYHDRGDLEVALGYFQKALEERERRGQESEILIARWCVGVTLRSLGRVEAALEVQQGLLAAHQRAGTIDGYVYEELAECLLALGKAEEARSYFASAYAELTCDAWLAENEPERLERLKRLGDRANGL